MIISYFFNFLKLWFSKQLYRIFLIIINKDRQTRVPNYTYYTYISKLIAL